MDTGEMYTEVALRALDHYQRRVLPEGANVRPEIMVRREAEMLLVELRAKVWGQTLRRMEWRAPADWWQAMKARWFPGWALARWPVVEVVRELDVWALYPELPVIDYGPELRFAVVGDRALDLTGVGGPELVVERERVR